MELKKVLKFLVFAAIGGLIFYFIQKSFDFKDFLINIKNANLFLVFCGTLTGILAVFFRALRWQLMLTPLGYKTSLANSYHSIMSGYLVNLGIPRSGEVYRCAVFSKTDKVPVNTLIGTVFSERIIDLLMLALVLFSSVMLQFDLLFNYINENVLSRFKSNNSIFILIAVLLIGGIGFVLVSKKLGGKSKLGNIIQGFITGIKSVFTIQKPFLFIIYTIVIWLCYLMMTYFVIIAFDFSAYLGISGSLSSLVFSTLGVIIPAPAGIATIGSIQLGLTQIYDFTTQHASAIAIVMFFSNLGMIIISGTISFIYMAFKTKI